MKNIIFNTIIITIGSIYLIGCSLTALPRETRDSINNTESGIINADNKLKSAKNLENDDYILHAKAGYFGNQVVLQNNADFLPPIFSNQIQIDKEFSDLRNIATSITDLTRLPTVLDISNSSNNTCANVRITQQDGNLIDLLNMISARCDIGWFYRDGELTISDTETKTWPIKGIPGDIQVQNQMNNNSGVAGQSGSSGGGSSGGSGGQSQSSTNQSTVQNIAFNLQNNLWQNLNDAVKSMLSTSGKLSISPATSSLTVTDRPSILMRVDHYIKNQNEILKRQVQIDIQVLNVDVTKDDNYGINWNLALKGVNGGFAINGQDVTSSSSGGSSFVSSYVFIPNNTTQAFTISSTSGDSNGSSLILNALSTITKASLVSSTALTTLSNQPVPVQFVDQLSYLASVQTTVTGAASTTQTALTPGQLTTGFSLNVLPVIEADGRVNLQLSLNISALKNMAQYSSENGSVQLPEVLQRNFMQKVVIKSGATFVVTGFDSDDNTIKNTGVGSAYNWLLGGGVNASNTRTRLVILVTPRVIYQ